MDDHRLVGEDEHAFTLLKGDDQFQVAKHGLDDSLLSQIRALPIYEAEAKVDESEPYGVRVLPKEDPTHLGLSIPDATFAPEQQSEPMSQNATSSEPQDLSQDLGNQAASPMPDWAKGMAQEGLDQQAQQQKIEQEQKALQAYQAQAAHNARYNGPNPIQNALNRQEDAINEQAKALEEEQKQNAEIYQKQVDNQQRYLNLSDKYMGGLVGDMKQLSDDSAKSKIDPQHYWNSKSTGSKVLTSIGIALSGMGAGWTDGRNWALDNLNKNIDRDVKAQEFDVNNKNTLFSQNLALYKDMNVARNTTLLQMAAITTGMILKTAAQSNSKQSMARAQQLVQEMQLKYGPLMRQWADDQIKMRMLQGGVPAAEEPTRFRLDEKHNERRVEANGKVYMTDTKEQRDKVREGQEHLGEIKELIQAMSKLNWGMNLPAAAGAVAAGAGAGGLAGSAIAPGVGTAIGTLGGGGLAAGGMAYKYLSNPEKAKAEFYKSEIIKKMNKFDPMGNTLTDGDVHLVQEMLANPNAFFTQTEEQGKSKNKLLMEHLDNHMKHLYESHLPEYKSGKSKKLNLEERP